MVAVTSIAVGMGALVTCHHSEDAAFLLWFVSYPLMIGGFFSLFTEWAPKGAIIGVLTAFILEYLILTGQSLISSATVNPAAVMRNWRPLATHSETGRSRRATGLPTAESGLRSRTVASNGGAIPKRTA